MATDPMHPPRMVPAAPLLPLLRQVARNSGGADALAHHLSARYGLSALSWGRQLDRINAGDTIMILLGQADRLACALGLHPALIWPVEWAHAGWASRRYNAKRRTAA